MRTTLDIDPVVLSAARARARAERISLGRAVSDLALAGLLAPAGQSNAPADFPVMAGAPDHPVTDELVAAFRDDGNGDTDAS